MMLAHRGQMTGDHVHIKRTNRGGVDMKPSPLIVLQARARARRTLYDAGELTLEDALEPLVWYAFTSDLVKRVGAKTVGKLIAAEFDGLVLWNSDNSPRNSSHGIA